LEELLQGFAGYLVIPLVGLGNTQVKQGLRGRLRTGGFSHPAEYLNGIVILTLSQERLAQPELDLRQQFPPPPGRC